MTNWFSFRFRVRNYLELMLLCNGHFRKKMFLLLLPRSILFGRDELVFGRRRRIFPRSPFGFLGFGKWKRKKISIVHFRSSEKLRAKFFEKMWNLRNLARLFYIFFSRNNWMFFYLCKCHSGIVEGKNVSKWEKTRLKMYSIFTL
jgi:hypothetical protein